MLCSIIIPTIGRETLTRSIESVINQKQFNENYEIIVVNDSGKPLITASWHNRPDVQIIHTQSREKSIARNVGAAIAKGKYLHFLDDDDWLMPQALDVLSTAAQANDSVLIFGSTSLVDRKGEQLVELRHDVNGNCFIQTMAGEWIPNGSYWISTVAFFAIGGYNPNMTVGEDSDLCRRLALLGDFTNVKYFVLTAGIGINGSSADFDQLPRQSRQAREIILGKSGVLKRMLDSANTSYWRGRIVRVYLTSALWNLQHRKMFTFVSRIFHGLLSLFLSGKNIFTSQFWRAITKPFESFTFSQGFHAKDAK